MTALARMNDNRIVIKPDANHRRNFRAAQHFFKNCTVDRTQHETMRRVVGELQSPVARHRLGDVDQQCVRHRITAVFQQRVDNFFSVVPCRPRVPETQRREAIRVHMLGRTLEFGERRDRPTALTREFVFDLEQQCLVGLHNQGSVGHLTIVPGVDSSARSSASLTVAISPSVSSATPVIRCTANVRGSSRR